MPDAKAPAAQTRVPIDKVKAGVSGTLGLGAIIAAAVAVQAPRTAQREGTILHSYQDPGKVWTGCTGRTQGMGPNMRFTPAQCAQWLREDLTAHTRAVAADTPSLVDQPSALEQAADFHFNAGARWWLKSPMRVHFRARQWRAGCEAFRGFITLVKVAKAIPGYRHFRKVDGQLYRELPGLVKRRESERAQCLAGVVT